MKKTDLFEDFVDILDLGRLYDPMELEDGTLTNDLTSKVLLQRMATFFSRLIVFTAFVDSIPMNYQALKEKFNPNRQLFTDQQKICLNRSKTSAFPIPEIKREIKLRVLRVNDEKVDGIKYYHDFVQDSVNKLNLDFKPINIHFNLVESGTLPAYSFSDHSHFGRVNMSESLYRFHQNHHQQDSITIILSPVIDSDPTTLGFVHDSDYRNLIILRYDQDTFEQGVLTHEMGHFLGLDHQNDKQNIMYPKAEISNNQTFTTDQYSTMNCALSSYRNSVVSKTKPKGIDLNQHPVSVKCEEGDFQTIQSAIDFQSKEGGGTIEICSGKYSESLTIDNSHESGKYFHHALRIALTARSAHDQVVIDSTNLGRQAIQVGTTFSHGHVDLSLSFLTIENQSNQRLNGSCINFEAPGYLSVMMTNFNHCNGWTAVYSNSRKLQIESSKFLNSNVLLSFISVGSQTEVNVERTTFGGIFTTANTGR